MNAIDRSKHFNEERLKYIFRNLDFQGNGIINIKDLVYILEAEKKHIKDEVYDELKENF